MNKKEIKKESKPKNRMYQVYELRDNLIAAIDNMKDLVKNNGLLVESVMTSKNKEELTNFTKALVEDCKEYTNKIDIYTERLNITKGLIEMYEKKDEQSELVVKVITDLIEALGITNEPQNYPTRA